MKDKELVGKTIKKVEGCAWDSGHKDWRAIRITFTDGTKIKIKGYSDCSIGIQEEDKDE